MVIVRAHPFLRFGVFAAQRIETGTEVLRFSGPTVHRDDLPVPYSDAEDHFTQIGRDLFLGPSGGPDDFVNHSCTPNTGLRPDLWLVALEDIDVGAEVTWDYSTYIIDDDWSVPCLCGTTRCRRRIASWDSIPEADQQRYVALGVAPQYVRR